MNNDSKNTQLPKIEEEWHVCKIQQMHKCSYDTIYNKFGPHINERRCVPVSIIKSLK